MKAIAILWNAMNPFFEEAIDDISNFAVIDSLEYVDFNDYEQFIKDIYALDTGNGKAGYSDYKADIMVDKYDSNQICILYLSLPTSEKIYIERKKTFIYKNVEDLKQFIRKKYKTKVRNYSFDNVFHMTDNDKEYNFVLNVINRHLLENIDKREKVLIKK